MTDLVLDPTAELTELATQANNMLRAAKMHSSQYPDGLQYGQIPGTQDYGIYNSSLLFLNAASDNIERRYPTVYALAKPYDEQYSERYGWTTPHTQGPAFFDNIQYGPFYKGRAQPLGIYQVKARLDNLQEGIHDTIRAGLRMTPTQDMVVTFFALQMMSSASTTDWHIQPVGLNPYLQEFLRKHVHAPLIFAALGSPKHGTRTYNRAEPPEIQAPRFSADEAVKLEPLNLPLALDLLNIHYFKTT